MIMDTVDAKLGHFHTRAVLSTLNKSWFISPHSPVCFGWCESSFEFQTSKLWSTSGVKAKRTKLKVGSAAKHSASWVREIKANSTLVGNIESVSCLGSYP